MPYLIPQCVFCDEEIEWSDSSGLWEHRHGVHSCATGDDHATPFGGDCDVYSHSDLESDELKDVGVRSHDIFGRQEF